MVDKYEAKLYVADKIGEEYTIPTLGVWEKFDDIDALAKSANLSTSRFSVLYKNMFGISPKKDIINARISKAKYLMSLGSQSLLEVSELCGYQNIYHFIRQFRTVTGITPGAYIRDYFS